MARREWTLLVVADDETRVRQLRITRDLIRAVTAGALLLVSVLMSAAGNYLVGDGEDGRITWLQQRNELLQAEVVQIRDRMQTLESTLGDLSRKDEHYRLLAGLEPLDEDVHRAGIGGPDGGAGAVTFATTTELNGMVRRARLLAASWEEATEALTRKHEELEATPSILPASGVLTSSFTKSRWHPILNRARPHEGIDITAPVGTPILAAAKGKVVKAGRDGDFGLVVEIDHGFGYRTRYAHASRLHVKVGQTIARGEVIARVGSTGLSAGPHLHYEVLVGGKPVNPRRFIFDGGPIRD